MFQAMQMAVMAQVTSLSTGHAAELQQVGEGGLCLGPGRVAVNWRGGGWRGGSDAAAEGTHTYFHTYLLCQVRHEVAGEVALMQRLRGDMESQLAVVAQHASGINEALQVGAGGWTVCV